MNMTAICEHDQKVHNDELSMVNMTKKYNYSTLFTGKKFLSSIKLETRPQCANFCCHGISNLNKWTA